jgi:hypothetical protein
MSNMQTQDALLAIALGKLKILELSCLVQADTSADWKENAVIRRPDGTFLRWEPGGTSPLKFIPKIPRKLKYLDTPKGTAKVSKEEAEGADVETAEELSAKAVKEIESLTEKLDGYQKMLSIAGDDSTKQRMRNLLKKDIDSIMNEIAKTSSFEGDMEGLTRSNRFNEYLGPVRNFVSRAQNSLKQGAVDTAKDAGGQASKAAQEVMDDSDKQKIALAAAGGVALTVLASVALKRGYAKALAQKVGKLSDAVNKNNVYPSQVAQVAKEIGLSPNRLAEVLPDVDPKLSIIEKAVAGAEDIKVVGKAIRRYRAGNVRRNVKQLDRLNKQARQKAEQDLAKLSDKEFDDAWEDLDSVFGHNWDKPQGWGKIKASSNTSEVAAASTSSMGTPLLLNAIASQDFKVFDDIMAMLPDFANIVTSDDLSGAESLSAAQKSRLQQELIELMVDCN